MMMMMITIIFVIIIIIIIIIIIVIFRLESEFELYYLMEESAGHFPI